MSVKVSLLILCIGLTGAGTAAAESITCPDMGLPLKPANPNMPSGKIFKDYIKDMHSGYVNCEYGPKNRILVSWFSSLGRDAWQDKCAQRRSLDSDGPVHVKFVKRKRWVIVSSKTNLALVYIWLSPREYRKRRQEWAAAGRKLLQENLSRGMSCEVHEPYTPTRARPEAPAVRSRPSEPAAPAQRYPSTQQGRDPAPKVKKTAPEPAAQPDAVDEKIDDILERLKSE